MTAPRIITTVEEAAYALDPSFGGFSGRTNRHQQETATYDARVHALTSELASTFQRSPVLVGDAGGLVSAQVVAIASAAPSTFLEILPKTPVVGSSVRPTQINGVSAGVQTENVNRDEVSATTIADDGSNLAPLDITSTLQHSRQAERQSDSRTAIEDHLEAANSREEARQLLIKAASDSRIPSVSGGATRVGIVAAMASVVSSGSADLRQLIVVTGGAGLVKLGAAANGTGDGMVLDELRALGLPLYVDPGMPEDLGGSNDETCIIVADPLRAFRRFWWYAYTIVDPYTLKKKGMIERLHGRFVRPVVVQPRAAARLQFQVP